MPSYLIHYTETLNSSTTVVADDEDAAEEAFYDRYPFDTEIDLIEEA